ncbi:MAG: hypothetical protein HQL37_15175, partial [Alphaproteobacteria bacterium]|nr:hypothetical protein [Alphaproteobacteria bacterium]
MSFVVRARIVSVVAAAVIAGWAWRAGAAPTSGPETKKEDAQPQAFVDGFRSAKLGMTERDVREAIHKDFSLGEKDVTAGTNDVDGTHSMTVKVKDLLPDLGPGVVSYILGAKTQKLIQVNVVWGVPEVAVAPLDTLVPAANKLRAYFARQGAYGKGATGGQKKKKQRFEAPL